MNWSRGKELKGTVFTEYSDDFYLDQNGHLRKKDIPKNDQEVVDSYFSTRLEAILDMYSDILEFPDRYHVELDPAVVEVDSRRSDLDRLLEADEIIENFRASDSAYDGLSRQELIYEMKQKYKYAVDAINAQRGEKNEAQNQQKDEQENVHENGNENQE